MLCQKARIIHERSISIPIFSTLPNSPNSKLFKKTDEYSLKQNCFDPSKSSPPNDFLLKLSKRISAYESIGINSNNDASE